MKDFFDIILIIVITLSMFICMMFFAEEVSVQQEGIHLRNRIVEIIEIENGYTEQAQNKVNNIIEKSNKDMVVSVSKSGILTYGEKIMFKIEIFYYRKLPFNIAPQQVKYEIIGEYYNING